MTLLFFALTATLLVGQDKTPPKSWLDPDTGHRIYRLTDEPNSASL